MKSLLFAALLFSGLSAAAQQPFVRKLDADTTGERLRKLDNIISLNSLLPQATYSHTTTRGKIYNLPIDNMPCLVPDMKQVAPMPRSYVPESKMPNAFPRQRLIPEEKKEKDK